MALQDCVWQGLAALSPPLPMPAQVQSHRVFIWFHVSLARLHARVAYLSECVKEGYANWAPDGYKVIMSWAGSYQL